MKPPHINRNFRLAGGGSTIYLVVGEGEVRGVVGEGGEDRISENAAFPEKVGFN